MRILLLHPEDQVANWLRNGERWDAIFDFGNPAEHSCNSGGTDDCPVLPVPVPKLEDIGPLKEELATGCGRLFDGYGFDWWELISVEFYERMVELLRMEQFAATCEDRDEFFFTRDGSKARILRALCPGRVHVLSGQDAGARAKLRRASRLGPRRALQVLGDKYDGSYRIRRIFSSRPKLSSSPVVLLPSAYENASRMSISYSATIPDLNFLLVATRDSGKVEGLPGNVEYASLASYAPGDLNGRELANLLISWQGLTAEFSATPRLSALLHAGCFDCVPQSIQQGLAIRNAWLQVFASEPVVSVLCADEMNWHTRLPLLIARSRGLPGLACHHGALDWRYKLRETSASVFLAKGHMERDYLVRSCGTAAEKIELAAPPRAQLPASSESRRNSIIFFSEPYEAFGGRGHEYYKQIIPRLTDLAFRNGCELVVKLHPFESRRERKRLAESLLSADRRTLLRIVDGPLKSELIRRAWFGVTIASTTALDCALNGVPAFLCRWLDVSHTGYADQFVKYGVAIPLDSPQQIAEILRMIPDIKRGNPGDLWQAATPGRLRQLILTKPVPKIHAPDLPEMERVWA